MEKADGPRRNLTQVLEEASDDDVSPRTQAKRPKPQQFSQSTLTFRAQPQAASRATSRALSDEDGHKARPARQTEKQKQGKSKARVQESRDEEDELMSENERLSQTPTTRGSTAASSAGARRATQGGTQARCAKSLARRQPEVIEIDDSDSESDDGQTFKVSV